LRDFLYPCLDNSKEIGNKYGRVKTTRLGASTGKPYDIHDGMLVSRHLDMVGHFRRGNTMSSGLLLRL